MARRIPVVADAKPKKELPKKVAISRATEKADGLGSGDVSVNSSNVMGLKMNVRRTKIDTAYELERAYNALLAGKPEDAMQIYEDILTGDPKNEDALFGLASTYHRAGQIDMARSLYAKLLELNPKHRDGLNNFLVLLADEAPQEALTQMEQLEAQNPGFSPIPAQMAIIYQKLGDQDKAVDKMYRALALSPENMTYRYNLAIMLDKNHDYSEAGKLYAQLLDSNAKGGTIPGDPTKIQQRLTFIRSNGPR
jgi:Tfp pilus assembly protein PilF